MAAHSVTRRDQLAGRLTSLLSVADEPTDDDDARLRKRVGLVAGVMTVFAPVTLPLQTQGHPLAWALGFALSAFSVGNLIVLVRTRRFERFVIGLVAAGTLFVPLATFIGGGLTGSSTGLVWGFLVPAYAILALGPARATAWFVAYVGIVVLMVALDPFVREAMGPAPYPLQLIAQAQNSLLPLTITFLLLRYTDVRRRAAEAQVDELLTNAIPRAIATRLKRGERRIAETYPRRRCCSRTWSASRRGRNGPRRRVSSRCSTRCSRASTS